MTIFRDYALSAMSLLAGICFSSSSLAGGHNTVLDIDSSASFIEGCVGIGACERVSLSGQIRLLGEFDTAAGELSLVYLDVMVDGPVDPSSPLEIARILLFDAEGFTGVVLPIAGPFTVVSFEGTSGTRDFDLTLSSLAFLPGQEFLFQGGFDGGGSLSGPSARIHLEGMVVPEPGTGILMGLGLLAMGARPRQRG